MICEDCGYCVLCRIAYHLERIANALEGEEE